MTRKRRTKPGPKPRAHKRARRLQIMLLPEVDAQVTAAAEAAGQSRSDWGETLVRQALAARSTPTDPPT